MAQEVPNDLKDLIVQFVNTYSNMVDLELDQNLDPKLWFMPINSDCGQERGCTLFLTRSIPKRPEVNWKPKKHKDASKPLTSDTGAKTFLLKEY